MQHRTIAPDAVLLNRRSAFDVFDVQHNGEINALELTSALMGCDDVRSVVCASCGRRLRDGEIQAAMDRVGVAPGGVVSFDQFSAMCDIVCHMMEHRRVNEERRAAQRHQDDQEVFSMAFEMAHHESPAAILPSPRRSRIVTGQHPELGPIQRTFYSFNVDDSGLVLAHELPAMLAMVGIKKSICENENKWHAALADIYPPKEPTDLLSVYDFHDACLLLKPSLIRELPERPRPPPPETPKPPPTPPRVLTPSELAELEQARLDEEERLRNKERMETLHVRLPDSRTLGVPGCEPSTLVGTVMQRIDELTAAIPGVDHIPASVQRLICQGYEMAPNTKLEFYKVRIGHPQIDRGQVVTMLLREPDQEAPETRGQLGVIYIKTSWNETFELTAKEEDSVGDLMARLGDLCSVPPDQMRLVGNGRELAPPERLRDSGVSLGDTLVLMPRPTSPVFF